MTEPAIMLRKVALLREQVARLRRRRPPAPDALVKDVDLQDAIAMSLLVAVQSALDIALHLASDRGWGLPATYAESFKILEREGVLTATTAGSLANMATLRNRIAHGYASVDFARIWEELPVGIDSLDRFAAAVAPMIKAP